MTVLLNIIMHSKTHLTCLAAGLRSDPLGGELTALARPQLLATENGFSRRWDKKEGMKKNKRKEKSIVVPQNLILLSSLL